MKITLLLFILLVPVLASAQSCMGGLGDPIVDVNFGSGPNVGPPLASGITNMTYVSTQCPNDGQYTIANSTAGCFGGNWLNIPSDHTGNPQGYMMIVNASIQPSDFYVETVTGLCPSTSYQFAAWILNLAATTGQILPNVTFTIQKTDGTVLQSLSTGDIPYANPAKWVQYAFYFTTPPGISSVVIRMTNNAPGGYGNDLCLDDITFRTAGPTIGVTMTGHGSDTAVFCPGLSNLLQMLGNVQSCYASTDYQWQLSTDNGASWGNIPGASTTNYTAAPTTSGDYLYRLTVAQTGNLGITNCQVASVPDTVRVLPLPNPSVTIASDSAYVCAGDTAGFLATPVDGGPAPVFQWLLNGAPVGANVPSFSTTSLVAGDDINCLVTSNAACVISPNAISNTIALNVVPDVSPSVLIDASANPICQDSLVTFSASLNNGGTQPFLEWELNGVPVASGTSTFSFDSLANGDQVQLLMNSSLKCASPASSNVITMTVYPKPVIVLAPDTVVAPKNIIRLDPTVSGQIASYTWLPATGLSDPASPDPTLSPVETQTYTLAVSTFDGCTASASETIYVYFDLLMPGAFTPNGDGHNDLFIIPAEVPVGIQHFSVYDRWGTLVFATTDRQQGWDGNSGGRMQPAGTYVWVIEYIDPLVKRPMVKKGTVVLIR